MMFKVKLIHQFEQIGTLQELHHERYFNGGSVNVEFDDSALYHELVPIPETEDWLEKITPV